MTMGFLAKAQTGKIKGFVYDKENGEPVLFTNVTIKGTTLGAATDVNGYYTVTHFLHLLLLRRTKLLR